MGLIGLTINGQDMSFDDALLASLRGETAMGFPVMAAIVAGQKLKDRPDASAGFSASQFQGCARKVILEHVEDYYQEPERLYAMSRGTLVHKTIEAALAAIPPELLPYFRREERLHSTLGVTYDGQEYAVAVHGQFDLAFFPPKFDPWLPTSEIEQELRLLGLPPCAYLYDHKNTAFIPREAKEEHVWQVSIYAWLMFRNGWDAPRRARIEYMDNRENVQHEVELYDHFEVEEYLEEKLVPLIGASLRGILPDRVDEEGRWACGANRTKTVYCPFAARCWPDGIGQDADWYDPALSPDQRRVFAPKTTQEAS